MRLLLTVVALLTLLLFATAAEARVVSCGEVITEDTVMDNDLECTGDNSGITIGADNVTFDLGGHTLIVHPVDATGTRAIQSVDHSGVTIRNGTVRETRAGTAVLVTGTNNRVADIDGRSYLAIALRGSGNLLEDSTLGGFGSLSVQGDGAVVRDNTAGPGFPAFSGSGHRIVRNDFAETTLEAAASVVRGNQFDGLWVGTNGDDNLIARNSSTGGPFGIFVRAGATGNLLRANNASGNATDGIRVDEPLTTLRRNVANDNGQLGMDAVAGVTDAGGNRASGNDDPRQCVNVECSP